MTTGATTSAMDIDDHPVDMEAQESQCLQLPREFLYQAMSQLELEDEAPEPKRRKLFAERLHTALHRLELVDNVQTPNCRELPAELMHMAMSLLELDDLHKCRRVSRRWNDLATEELRSFAVLNRSRLQRRWDPEAAKDGESNTSLWCRSFHPSNEYWLGPFHPARTRTPPLREISVGTHHPVECHHLSTEEEDGSHRLLDAAKNPYNYGLPRRLPVLKISLQSSPLFENFWRIEDDPDCTPFERPTPIHGYKVANMHGEYIPTPSSPYTDGVNAVRPDDLTVQFTHCGFIDLLGAHVDTIGKLVLYNVPFMYGEVSDSVYDSFHHKVEAMVWILTYPGRCKNMPFCNDMGLCGEHATGIPDYKAKDLARIIPTGKERRLKKVTIVFKPKDPSMKWDKGCFHRSRRGAWWAPKLLGNLAIELAKPKYAGIEFEFVNLDCLSLTKAWKPGRKIEPQTRKKYLPEWMQLFLGSRRTVLSLASTLSLTAPRVSRTTTPCLMTPRWRRRTSRSTARSSASRPCRTGSSPEMPTAFSLPRRPSATGSSGGSDRRSSTTLTRTRTISLPMSTATAPTRRGAGGLMAKCRSRTGIQTSRCPTRSRRLRIPRTCSRTGPLNSIAALK